MLLLQQALDYLQLISDKVIVYRPIEKEYYTTDTVKEKFNITPHNFLLYKLLMDLNYESQFYSDV